VVQKLGASQLYIDTCNRRKFYDLAILKKGGV